MRCEIGGFPTSPTSAKKTLKLQPPSLRSALVGIRRATQNTRRCLASGEPSGSSDKTEGGCTSRHPTVGLEGLGKGNRRRIEHRRQNPRSLSPRAGQVRRDNRHLQVEAHHAPHGETRDTAKYAQAPYRATPDGVDRLPGERQRSARGIHTAAQNTAANAHAQRTTLPPARTTQPAGQVDGPRPSDGAHRPVGDNHSPREHGSQTAKGSSVPPARAGLVRREPGAHTAPGGTVGCVVASYATARHAEHGRSAGDGLRRRTGRPGSDAHPRSDG